MTTSANNKRYWGSIWKGRRRFRSQIFRIAWTILLFAMASWLWNTAVRTAAMPDAYKKASLALVAISLCLFIWGICQLLKVLRNIGLRSVLWVALVGFLLLIMFNFLTSPSGGFTGSHVLSIVSQSAQQVWSSVGKSIRSLINAPENYRFAYTSVRTPHYLPGFPTPDPNSQQVIQVDARTYTPPEVSRLQPGGYAILSDPEGGKIACRSNPDVEYPISARFDQDDRVLILEGPQLDGNDLGKWWLVHGLRGEGWCLEENLTPSN